MPLLAWETRHSNEQIVSQVQEIFDGSSNGVGCEGFESMSCMLLTSIWKYVPKTQYCGILYPIGINVWYIHQHFVDVYDRLVGRYTTTH